MSKEAESNDFRLSSRKIETFCLLMNSNVGSSKITFISANLTVWGLRYSKGCEKWSFEAGALKVLDFLGLILMTHRYLAQSHTQTERTSKDPEFVEF